MKRNVLSLILTTALVITLCTLSGCGEKKEMKIGYIDTDQLLAKCEKYKKIGNDFRKDQEELAKKYARQGSQVSPSDQEIEVRKLQEKWDKIKKDVREEIRSAAQEEAKQKKIDLVLDNTQSSPAIEYGGTDMTEDLIKRLK
jgi:outer membrane protein